MSRYYDDTIADLIACLAAVTANYEAFQSEALKSIDAMNQKLSDAMDANNALVSQGLALQARIETMLATRAHDPELIAAKAELEAHKAQIHVFMGRFAAKAKQCDELRNDLDNARVELAALKVERDALKATCEDYRIQACRPDECLTKKELEAVKRENEWHPASEPPMECCDILVRYSDGVIRMRSFNPMAKTGLKFFKIIQWRELPKPEAT
jgi:chromosome segregation ATPase